MCAHVNVCMCVCALCPGGIRTPPGCGLCGVTGQLDLVPSPTLTQQQVRMGVEIQEEAARVLGERPGKGPRFGSVVPTPEALLQVQSVVPTGAPQSHCSFELHGMGHTAGHTAGGWWSRTHSWFTPESLSEVTVTGWGPAGCHGYKGAFEGSSEERRAGMKAVGWAGKGTRFLSSSVLVVAECSHGCGDMRLRQVRTRTEAEEQARRVLK